MNRPLRTATRVLLLTVLAASTLDAPLEAAATRAPADLVTSNVDDATRIELRSERPAWARAKNDAGRVPDALRVDGLTVTLNRPPERRRAFEAFLAAQQDRLSPDYHHWLTPTELGERFGASAHDLDAIRAWLEVNGLRVDAVSNSRTRIRFSGSSADVAAAFSTELRYYRAGGAKRIANATTPSVPKALSGAIRSIEGLQSIRFHPTRVAPRRATRATGPAPAGTNCSGSSCDYVVFPADFAKIYDVGAITAGGIDGSGQSIAIVGRQRVYEPDIKNYQDRAGLAVKYPTVIVPPGGVDPGDPASSCGGSGEPSCDDPGDAVLDQGEATLDVQRAGSVAPGATIKLIVSDNSDTADGVFIATDYAVDTDPLPAHILSISFATCEADNGSAVVRSLDDYFAQAAAEGISVFVASGDAGVAGCASLDAAPAPGEAVSPNALCSSGAVTCVGGTEFADRADPRAYWASSNGPGFESALGYIPEGAWNEPLADDGSAQLASTGGGVSAFVARPAWQIGAGVPGTAGRYTPDVSLNSSTREGYFTCMASQQGPCSVANGSFSFLITGGTSAAAPSMAGITALLNQREHGAQGNLNPRLYALATDPGNAVFHDITVASSGVADCAPTSASPCNNSTPGPDGVTGGLAGYLVGAGYDEATGLGSIDAKNLLDHWNDAPSTQNPNQAGLSGPWYDPATSGQGLVIDVAPDFYGSGVGLVFGGWFTFDTSAAGGTRWYTVQGQVSSATPATTLPIYVAEGGNFDAPPAVGVGEIGQATLSFADCTHATMTYAFDDGTARTGTIPLQRIGANVGCSPGGAANPDRDYLLSGAWYEHATGGQGLVVDVNPAQRSFFAAWYTYAPNGSAIGGGASQRWYTLQSAFAPGATSLSNVTIYATSGGVFDDPATATTTAVGSASVVFHSCSSATLTYAFSSGVNAGRSGSIALQRAVPATSGCSL